MFNLDLTNVKENSFEPIPSGTYYVICDESEVKTTKDGTGEYINIKFKILSGEHEGRAVFNMFNIKNKNEKAVNIGIGQLKTFMKCAGETNMILKSPLDLIGLRCDAVVKVKTDEYGDKAVISYFKPHTGETTTTPVKATRAASPF